MKKLFFVFVACLFFPVSVFAGDLASQLKGRILLQTESRGEAWYVNPADSKRYYLKDGITAYDMMRKLSIGISENDIKKIPVGIDLRFMGTNSQPDKDGDGLYDKLEEAIGTNPSDIDTDKDSYDDGREVLNGYNSFGAGKMSFDNNLINRLKGKILLQVEKRGQAWYLNPVDGKKYYMSDGDMAYQLMRFLSLGITDRNLAQIGVGQLQPSSDSELDSVKNSFNKLRDAILAKNNSLALDYVTKLSLESFGGKLTYDETIIDIQFINGYKEDNNYIVDQKVIYKNGRTEVQEGLVYIKEDGIWKEGPIESLSRALKKFEEEKVAAELTQVQNGKVDLIITGIKFYPEKPKVNDKSTEMEIFIKNIGTKTALEGVSYKVDIENSILPEIDGANLATVIKPGETITSMAHHPYLSDIFGKDEPGLKKVTVTIDDLNVPMDDITSNNTYSEEFEFVE